MVNIAGMLNRLHSKKILVIGDFFLDTYTFGKARRISPEAPVPVISVSSEKHLPGGAGNVALNLVSLGSTVVVVGRVGSDETAELLLGVLNNEGINTSFMQTQKNYRTPVKNRLIADNQQIVRIDHEKIVSCSTELEDLFEEIVLEALLGIDVIAISDYGKGFLTDSLLSILLKHAKRLNIPVITDPKGTNFLKYRGSTVIKPNLSEAYAASGLPMDSSLEEVASAILEKCETDLLMITRSEEGISLFERRTGKRFDYPAVMKEVKDVTGAGDTVLAVLVHSIANGLDYHESSKLCNVAAGIAIEQVGCARVTLADLAVRLFYHNGIDKVFDEEHLFVLKEILGERPYQLLVLTQIDHFTPHLYQQMKMLSSDMTPLVIFLNKNEEHNEMLELISSTGETHYIITGEECFKQLSSWKLPQETHLYMGREQQKLQVIDSSKYQFGLH